MRRKTFRGNFVYFGRKKNKTEITENHKWRSKVYTYISFPQMFIHLGISLKGMTVFAQVPVEVLGSTSFDTYPKAVW